MEVSPRTAKTLISVMTSVIGVGTAVAGFSLAEVSLKGAGTMGCYSFSLIIFLNIVFHLMQAPQT